MDADKDLERKLLANAVAKCGFPVTQISILELLTDQEFGRIGDGIVFVFASWAGQSRRAFSVLTAMLREAPFINIHLYVVDIGNCDIKLESFGKVRFGGFGETFWVKNGQIKKIGSNYDESDLNDLRAITNQVFHDK